MTAAVSPICGGQTCKLGFWGNFEHCWQQTPAARLQVYQLSHHTPTFRDISIGASGFMSKHNIYSMEVASWEQGGGERALHNAWGRRSENDPFSPVAACAYHWHLMCFRPTESTAKETVELIKNDTSSRAALDLQNWDTINASVGQLRCWEILTS